MKRAYYDLTRQPASFDFWMWITFVRKMGAELICFGPLNTTVGEKPFKYKYRNEPQDRQEEIFKRVVLNICCLWNIPYEFGNKEPGDITHTHVYRGSITKTLTHDDLFKFDLESDYDRVVHRTDGVGTVSETIREPVKGPPTVTMRKSVKNPERDSDEGVWREFAEEIGAIVIEDAWVKPISIADRFELYRRAPVNYFNSNGPGAAAIFSNLNAVMVNPPSSYVCRYCDIGKQYPFSTGNQRMLWGDATLKMLRDEHKRFIQVRACVIDRLLTCRIAITSSYTAGSYAAENS